MGWAKCLEIRSCASAGLYELMKIGSDYEIMHAVDGMWREQRG